MKTFAEVQELVQKVRCSPYVLEFGCLLCHFYHDAKVPTYGSDCTRRFSYQQHPWFIRAWLERADIDTGEHGWGMGAPLLVMEYMSLDEIVKKCFVACREYSEHEVREGFEYDGSRVLGPHVPIAGLKHLVDGDLVLNQPTYELSSSLIPERLCVAGCPDLPPEHIEHLLDQ